MSESQPGWPWRTRRFSVAAGRRRSSARREDARDERGPERNLGYGSPNMFFNLRSIGKEFTINIFCLKWTAKSVKFPRSRRLTSATEAYAKRKCLQKYCGMKYTSSRSSISSRQCVNCAYILLTRCSLSSNISLELKYFFFRKIIYFYLISMACRSSSSRFLRRASCSENYWFNMINYGAGLHFLTVNLQL